MLGQTRQPYVEDGTFPVFGFHPYFAFHLLGDGFTDGQSQTRTLGKIVQFGKPLKYPSQLFGLDTQSGIFDVEYNSLAFLFVTIAYAAFCGKFERVAYQVREYLEDPVLVRVDA